MEIEAKEKPRLRGGAKTGLTENPLWGYGVNV
jgi:hypothetical protein